MKLKIITAMATALFELVIFTSPAYAGAADDIQRGDYYAANGYLGAAVLAYTVAIEAGDRNERILARFQRARVYVAMQKWKAASDDFGMVVNEEDDWRKAQSGLAWSLHQQGKQEQALPHALAAVQLAPDDHYAWDTLGRILLALGDIPNAAHALRTAWQTDPERIKSFNLLNEFHLLPMSMWFDIA
ncbi:MAG: hypothetical protein NUV59_03460 [Patescibacteria group bacterium]|nr:hypothetical protein [Patescibacteria group bacterium]